MLLLIALRTQFFQRKHAVCDIDISMMTHVCPLRLALILEVAHIFGMQLLEDGF